MPRSAAVAQPRNDDRTIDPTEGARRSARYTYAKRRIEKIADGLPSLTEAQRAELALILYPGGGSDAPAT